MSIRRMIICPVHKVSMRPRPLGGWACHEGHVYLTDDMLKDDGISMKSEFVEGFVELTFLQRLKLYFNFTFGYLRINGVQQNGHWGFWVRTPLIVVGYKQAQVDQDRTRLETGWSIDFIPVRWNLKFERGGPLYRHHWNNLRMVGYLEDLEIRSNIGYGR